MVSPAMLLAQAVLFHFTRKTNLFISSLQQQPHAGLLLFFI